jgi:hypothetical protein
MGKLFDIPERKSKSLAERFPLVDRVNLPNEVRLIPVSFKKEEIGNFEVLLFHRLMKENYGLPSQVEAVPSDDVRKALALDKIVFVRDGDRLKWELSEIPPATLPRSGSMTRIMKRATEWRYFISAKSGSIIQFGTEESHHRVAVHLVVSEGQKEISDQLKKDSETFINDILREAERNRPRILDPKREFVQEQNVGLFLLHNVYLYNYGSAELMRSYAEDHEGEIASELLKYDHRDGAFEDHDKTAHIERFMLGVGMYYAAAISYYFMALEGFINLFYEAYLRDEFRDKEFNWERDLSLDKKIRLMPRLCAGFKTKVIKPDTVIFKQFKNLRDQRNQIFHAKIVDSMKGVCFMEHGFAYTLDMVRGGDREFPAHKGNLKPKDVLITKNTVDDIIRHLLDAMTKRTRTMVQRFILKEVEIPFWKNGDGKILFGKLNGTLAGDSDH